MYISVMYITSTSYHHIFFSSQQNLFCHRLEKMLEVLLSTLSEAGLWDNITSVVPQLETVIGSMVSTTQAENGKNPQELCSQK